MKNRWKESSSLTARERSELSRDSSSKTLTTGFFHRFSETVAPFFRRISLAQKDRIRNRKSSASWLKVGIVKVSSLFAFLFRFAAFLTSSSQSHFVNEMSLLCIRFCSD